MHLVDPLKETSQIGRLIAAIASGDEKQRILRGRQPGSQASAETIMRFMAQDPNARIFFRQTLGESSGYERIKLSADPNSGREKI
jgi:hypothetical protein